MATDLRSLPAYLNSDATFRAWGGGISAQLAAVGLVQTADTGQINWTTVLKPSANSYAGFEVWRFNDSLQATKPVFVKFNYGVGAVADRPQVFVTVGTATNGTGTITGQVGTGIGIVPNSSKTAGATLPSYCSGSTSRLNLCTNLDSANIDYFICVLVERAKDGAGADTGNGIVTWLQYLTSRQYQIIPFSGSIPTVATTNMAASLSSAGVSSVGPNVALSPTIASLGKAYFASWCAYLHADLGELQAFTANHLGASHTFMPLGDGLNSTGVVQGTATGHSLAMRWE